MDLTIPSERSITLMAGIFKFSPIDLVDGTTYPTAKAERLPELTNLYTELELQQALLLNDFEWLQRLDNSTPKSQYIQDTLTKWLPRLEQWNLSCLPEQERTILLQMKKCLDVLKTQMGHLAL